MRDIRREHILHKGDMIEVGDVIYTITDDFLSYGGSSVIYSAECSEDRINYVIKEVFPNRPGQFHRSGGIIQPVDPEDRILVQYRNRLKQEKELGDRCYNGTRLAINIRRILHPTAIITGGKRYENVGSGLFALLDSMNRKTDMGFTPLLEEMAKEKDEGQPLRSGRLPTLYATACIIEKVLETVQAIHEQGVLFGDIHTGNILFSECRPEQGRLGVACMLDFGCARELTKDGKTSPIADRQVFSTDGYTPPELLYRNDGTLQLGPEADIFSVGCLMLRCLFPEEYIRYKGKSPSIGDQELQPDAAEELGITEKQRKDVNKILFRAMHRNSQERYPSAEAMLEDIKRLKRDTKPPEYLLPANLSLPDYFVPNSRDKEIAVFSRALMAGQDIFIHGVGGIGKSEVAIELAKRIKPSKGAYLVHFQNSMRETILNLNFSGYKYAPDRVGMTPEEQEQEDYEKRMNILREHYRNALIIIDNFDCEGKTLADLQGEQAFKDLNALSDIRKVFTTRYLVPKKDWEIGPLSEDNLIKLMREPCPESLVSDEQLKDILKAINYHTLTAILIARTLAKSRGDISPQMLLNAFAQHELELEKEDYPLVTSDQNREYNQRIIYEHLAILFNLSNLNEIEKQIMYFATLIPQGGMNGYLFRNSLQRQERKALDRLEDCGWIRHILGGDISLHPVIRFVCSQNLVSTNITQSTKLEFIEALITQFEDTCQSPNCDVSISRDIENIIYVYQALWSIGSVISTSFLPKVKKLYDLVGQKRIFLQGTHHYINADIVNISYNQTETKYNDLTFVLDESNGTRYAAYLIAYEQEKSFSIQLLESTTSKLYGQTFRRFTVPRNISHSQNSIYIFALHSDIKTMYRYSGYFSPKGVMINIHQKRLPLYFILNQNTGRTDFVGKKGRKVLARVVDYCFSEEENDMFRSKTISEVERKYGGKALFVDANNIEKVILSDELLSTRSFYYADFIFGINGQRG